MRCEGINSASIWGVSLAQGLPGHLHWHIVPRWSGDYEFYAVMAGVRVIPQALDALFDLLFEE